MIVYVETNFVLELALLQSEHRDCTTLIDMAAANEITLVIPAYCLSEPYGTLVAHGKRRKDVHDDLHNVIEELSRSESYGELRNTAQAVQDALSVSSAAERQRLDTVLGHIMAVATVIPLDGVAFRAALALLTNQNIPPQDALVYSSVSQCERINMNRSASSPRMSRTSRIRIV
jgi:predicted nucleic acid-binding protein